MAVCTSDFGKYIQTHNTIWKHAYSLSCQELDEKMPLPCLCVKYEARCQLV